jgi:competence protein ComEC
MTRKEIIIVFILIIIAITRFLFFLPKAPDYKNVVGQSVNMQGIVTDYPDERLTNTRLNVSLINQDINILVVVSRGIEVSYGDKVKVTGVLETPENFITSSGKEFDYEKYLANQDIYYIIKTDNIEIISNNNGSRLQSFLFYIRSSFMKNIGRVLYPPESDLANGLLLGSRGGFDTDMRNEFISTGTIHIVALSGYNVTIVAESVMKVLGTFLAQTVATIFGILFIFLFIMMAGFSSTAIRAGIMAIIALFARMTGRNYDAGRALVITALLMVVYDPRVLTDISFQLSFLATGGVLFITPKVILWVKFMPMRFGFREIVATTIGANIAVLPILLYSTGIFSVVSLPANILILPIIPLTMFFSFITGMVGFILPILSIPFAYISHLLLMYILSTIHFFASLPFASFTISSFPLILTILIYAFLIWWVFRK